MTAYIPDPEVRYFIRCEVGNDNWHEVSPQTYLWYENGYRWGCQWEPADYSRFDGRGIEGYVLWKSWQMLPK